MKIGQLARQSQLNPKTIRFWEQVGLLDEPRRTESGYRLYDESHIERVHFVVRAKRLGLSLDEIREIIQLQEGGQTPCIHVEHLLQKRLEELREVQAELAQLQADLQSALDQTQTALAQAGGSEYCPVIAHSQASRVPLPLAERALKKRPR